MNEILYSIVDLIFILLFFLVFIVNYAITKKQLFHPSVLFSFTWTLVLLLHFIFRNTILNELYSIHVKTYLIFFVGLLCFSSGSLLVSYYYQKKTKEDIFLRSSLVPNIKISAHLRIGLLIIVLGGLPFYLQASYRVFLASNIDNFFVGLRTELSYGEEDLGITKYLISFSFFVFAINYYFLLIRKNKFNLWNLGIGLIVTIIYSLFSTGRTYFFLIFSIYLVISYLLNLKFSLRKHIWPLGIFIIIFISIGIIYGKGGNKEDNLKENISASSEVTATYIVASLNAFDWETSQNLEPNYRGDNTLRFFNKILQNFGFYEQTQTSLLSEFVFIPYPTNVYTFYSPYIRDFGKIYAWMMLLFFGGMHSWLFHKAVKSKSFRFTIYYSISVYPLLMSFFQDQYMSLLSTWIQMIFYIEAFVIINQWLTKRRKSESKHS